MKKVLVIAPYLYLPYFSGGQKFIAQFADYLGREVVLTVISVPGNDVSLATHYRLLPLLKKSVTRYIDQSLVKKITAEAIAGKYDAIIWEHPYFAWLAFRVRKKTGIKTFIHTHNIEYQRFRSTGRWWWPILKHYEKWCFKKADGLFFITPEDKNFAITQWNIDAAKCIDLPFGITNAAYPADRDECKKKVQQLHGIAAQNHLLLFNGMLHYKPNLEALQAILETINPLLLNHVSFPYTIIICGKGLPEEMNQLKDYADKNIIYAGFVEDIDLYFKAADIFLNPVLSGGGVKTKMVEAIAFGTTVVASATGAAGIDTAAAGDKLKIVPDNDWNQFANAILTTKSIHTPTPEAYYQYYYWENIIRKIKKVF